jgi:hypothetical protein
MIARNLEVQMITNLDSNPVHSSRSQYKGFVVGAILILLGLAALFSQLGIMQIGEYFTGFLGIVFIIGAFLRRKNALLVPGGIMLGINAAALLQGFRIASYNDGGLFLIAFAGGWLLISALSVILNRVDSSAKIMLWPLIPGAIIASVGALLMSGEMGFFLLKQLSLAWPIVLIILGLWIIFRRR